MDYIAISSINCVAEISENDFSDDTYLEKLETLRDDISCLLEKHNIKIESIESTFLNTKKYSIHKCSKCLHLMIDRGTNPVKAEVESLVAEVIYDGAKIHDDFLCEDCLPSEHRWSSK